VRSEAVCEAADSSPPPDDSPVVDPEDDVDPLPAKPRALVEAVAWGTRELDVPDCLEP
jgi:hypothetical protein